MPFKSSVLVLVDTAQVLWKTSTTVSSQGRARGRAKGLMRIKNLNRGQRMGYGPGKIAWPGLTVDAVERQSKKIAAIGKISDENYQWVHFLAFRGFACDGGCSKM